MRLIALCCVLVGVAWACGGNIASDGSSSTTSTVGGANSVSLPFDPTQGCRDFSSPGCAQCCMPGVDYTGAQVCNVQQAYSSSVVDGACSSDCQPCAPCNATTESSLLDTAANPRTACDCPHVDIGIDPCFSNGCECFCSRLFGSLLGCPQLGPTVCKSGNHCGVELLVEPGPYHPGDTLNVYWFNFSSNTAIVNDCGNPDVQQLQESSVTYFVVASPLPCASNSVMTLAPGAQVSTTVNVPTGVGGGFFRVHGTYYLECPAGTSSPAACGSSPIDVSSNFDVYSQ